MLCRACTKGRLLKHPNFAHSLEANTLRQAVNTATFPCLIRLQMKVQESIWGVKFFSRAI